MARAKKATTSSIPKTVDANAELEKLREQLARLRGVSPSFKELMQQHKEQEKALEVLEKQISVLYPDLCPHCSFCGMPFSRGCRGGCRGGY